MTRTLPPEDLAHVAHHAADAFRALDGGHVAITGASGLIGSWMLDTLVAARASLGTRTSITAIVRDPARLRSPAGPGVQVVTGDVRTITAIAPQVTHVVHTAIAASPAVNASEPEEVIDLIRRGTASVVRAAGAARLLVVSSGSVYATGAAQVPFAESAPLMSAPVNVAERFGAAKADADAEAMRGGAIAARVFSLVGPRLPLDGQFALGQFLGAALRRQPPTIEGDPEAVRSYLHLADLAAWCWRLLVSGERGTAYNVGSASPRTIASVARDVAALVKPPLEARVGERRIVSTRRWLVPDTTRARTALGVDEWIGWDDALGRTWRWLSSGAAG